MQRYEIKFTIHNLQFKIRRQLFSRSEELSEHKSCSRVITTQEQEAAEYNGNDWSEVVRQRRKEIEAMADLTPVQDPVSTKEDDDE